MIPLILVLYMQILICTGNPGKVRELRALLPKWFELVSLDQAGLSADLPETGETLEENALQKARLGNRKTRLLTIADDSGLEVNALQGAPGVYSARYAGPAADAQANVDKLLSEMRGQVIRTARFRAVIAFVDGPEEHLFTGEIEGRITTAQRGRNGFGYDPVFIPSGSNRTFAAMSDEEKNSISHRGHAVRALVSFLKERYAKMIGDSINDQRKSL